MSDFDQTVIDSEPAMQMVVAEPDQQTSPLALIAQAVQSGLGADQLKALVDLQEQVRSSRARELFAAAMTACQAELPSVVKDAENTHTNKRYASLEVVQRVAKPVILKHGFALSFSEADCQTPNFKRTVCKVRHSAGHSEDHFLDLPVDKSGSMNAVQGAVSTGSYGQRVLTCRIFNITIADTDMDGRGPAHPNPEANLKAPKAPPRNQRQPAKPPGQKTDDPIPGISAAALKVLLAEWNVQHGPGDESKKDEIRTGFQKFVTDKAGREFNAFAPSCWDKSDEDKVSKGLGLPTPKELEDVPW